MERGNNERNNEEEQAGEDSEHEREEKTIRITHLGVYNADEPGTSAGVTESDQGKHTQKVVEAVEGKIGKVSSKELKPEGKMDNIRDTESELESSKEGPPLLRQVPLQKSMRSVVFQIPEKESNTTKKEEAMERAEATDASESSLSSEELGRNVVEARTKKLTKQRQPKGQDDSESSLESSKPSRMRIDPLSTSSFSSVSLSTPLSSDVGQEQKLRTPQENIGKISRTNLGMGNAFVYMIIPPDGGFGWIILVISFLCQLVVDGLIFSIGIIMPYIADDLEVTQAEIVLVVSIQIGCYFLTGPISSATINKYGFRPVALAGSLLSVTSILLASFSPDLPTLIFFYSIMGGPSLSMIWVSSQLIIGYYFERLRPIANGLSVSGAGAGILLASALNSAVVTHIGWRNTLRIHVCLLSTIFFMGMAYIEVKPTRIGRVIEPELDTDVDYEHSWHLETLHFSNVLSEYTLANRSLDYMLSEYEKPKDPGFFKRIFFKCCPMLSKWIRNRRMSVDEVDFGTKLYVLHTDLIDRQDLYYTGPADYVQQSRAVLSPAVQLSKEINARSVNNTLSMLSVRSSAQKHKSKHPCLEFFSPLNWLPLKIGAALQLLFDFRLLHIVEFQILLASAFFFPMGYNIPFVYSTVRADIPSEYKKMISPAIGFSNFLFRIISGFLAWKYKEYTTIFCGYGIVIGGLITFISAFYGANIIWFQFVYAFIYGVAPAFFSTLRAIIYVRALGLDKLTNAFGLTGMSMGLGVFIGTTLAGNMNEDTGSYSAAFAFAGCCIMLAGGLKIVLPHFMAWRERERTRKQKRHSSRRSNLY